MADGIVYLDIDDEITSAAARIRGVAGRRVALVVPYGARVATSRINFRLLSRDAMINEKQLAVVAGDSATRALAASAGLPVFGSVSEYASSLTGPLVDPGAPAAALETDDMIAAATPDPIAPVAPAVPAATAATTATAATAATAASTAPSPTEPSPTKPSPSEPPAPADAAPVWTPTVDAPTLWGLPAPTSNPPRGGSAAPASHRPDKGSAIKPAIADVTVAGLRASNGPDPSPVISDRPAASPRPRSPLRYVVALGVLALVVLSGGVGAYLALPSATIVVTPQPEGLAPVEITVTADPTVTAPDPAALLIPAQPVVFEVSARETFPATGKRIEESSASGRVRFENLDFLRSNVVPSGSIVSTNAGARFRTTAAVTVPKADIVGLTIFPGRIEVNVTAVEPGTAGNVEPNTIVIVPRGEDPKALKVVNKAPTEGGTLDEFPVVAEEDVDAALEQLTVDLAAAFRARLADPSLRPSGTKLLIETAVLGEVTPSEDPTAFVGQEIETFTLGLGASATVLAVDPTPIEPMAEALVRASVEPGFELVAGSIEVDVGEPVVTGGSIIFRATATGRQIAILDPADLQGLVLGKPLAAAREILAPYGSVELTAWPDWVVSVPTAPDRVIVRIERSVSIETAPPATGQPSGSGSAP